MATIFAAIIFMLLVVGAMSIGVIMGRKPIAGSCGGVGAALAEPDYICELCGNDPAKCVEENREERSDDKAGRGQFYDAGQR